MVSVRCLIALLVVWAVIPPACAEMATLTTKADEVEVSWDGRTISLRGNAELHARSEEDPSKWVRVTAELIEGNLETGKFEAIGDVLMVTEQASMRGASLAFDANTSHYELKRGGVAVDFGDTPEDGMCGFAYGREMRNEGHLIHLTGARFTTCSRLEPHYALEAKRLTVDSRTGHLYFRGASVRLYGVKIPLLPHFWYKLSEGRETRFRAIPRLRLGSRDGLMAWWPLPFRYPERQITTTGGIGLTTRRGIRGELDIQGPIGSMTGHVRVSHKEDVRSDLDQWSLVDRRPELALENAWDTDLFGGARLDVELAAGSYREKTIGGGPNIYDHRAMASAVLGHNLAQRDKSAGQWWWVGAREQIYDQGGDYTVFEAGVGAGKQFNDWLGGSLTYSYHHTMGASPFEFDDVDIDQELTGRLRFDFDENWSLRTSGRYDLDFGRMRDYEIELARRCHCLTWKVAYRGLTENISLGVAINGLFGGEPGGQDWSVADGPPDYWRWRDSQQQADSTGEPMSQTTDTTE